MNKIYLTLTALNRYLGGASLRPGQEIVIRKDKDNCYDDEAIEAVLQKNGGRIAYVANSVHTVARGTHSAGYLYNMIGDSAECIIRFIVSEDCAIAELETNENEDLTGKQEDLNGENA